jgi:HK97 family phage portal protein
MAILDYFRTFFTPNKTTEKRGFLDQMSRYASGSAISVSTDSAMSFAAVFAAIRILSESVAQLPIQLCERDANGDKTIRNDHPLYNLIHRKPNGYMTTYIFMQKIITDLCTNGNSYVQIVRNNTAQPLELLPLQADQMSVKQIDGKYFYQYSGGNSGQTIFEADDLLHFKGLTTDGLIGLSPIDTCANSIGWGLSLEKYGNTYFQNGAKVSGVLQTDRSLSTEAVDRLRNSFNANYSNIGDSNKTLILEEGLKFSGISLSNEASQFLVSRQFSIEEIARIFNLPPHLLRDLSKSSFSNIQEQSREFVQYSLMPYLKMIESEINGKLFKQTEIGKIFVEFNVNALLRGNPKDRSEYYRTMLNIGAMSINEIRQKENLNAIEEGDNLFMQMNMTTLTNIVEGQPVEEAPAPPEIDAELLEEEEITNGTN